MVRREAKPAKFAEELRAELDWAAQVLTGDTSPDRIIFALPVLATGDDAASDYNWDVEVSCRPDQDDAAQAAILHVANKWNLAVPRDAGTTAHRLIEAAHRGAPRPVSHGLRINGNRRNGG